MNKKTILLLIVEALLFLGIISLIIVNRNEKLNDLDQNLKASQQELYQLELKNKDVITVRDLYIIKEKELSELLDIKNDEIKDLKKKLKSNINYIADIKSNVRIDTISIVKDSIVYLSPTILTSDFCYYDEWLHFNGSSTMNLETDRNEIIINNLDMNIPIRTGLTDDYQIFIQSDNPYVEFSSIEGAVIDKSKLNPEKNRWNFGLQFGFGGQYGLINNRFDVGPYFGAGVEFNF